MRRVWAFLCAGALGCTRPAASPSVRTESSAPSATVEPVSGAVKDRRSSSAQVAGETHVEEATGAIRAPTTYRSAFERLQEMIAEFPAGSGAARVVVIDIAFPRSIAEFEEMGGWTYLLLTAVTRDSAELPLKRTYLRMGKHVVELQRATERATVVPDEYPDIRERIGTYRYDTLYFIPVMATQLPSQVAVDFAANRTNFVVQTLPMPDSERSIPDGVDLNQELKDPDRASQLRFAQREYPFLFPEQ